MTRLPWVVKQTDERVLFCTQIELPHPTEEARARILQIHSRKMNVDTEGKQRESCSGH